MISLKFSLLKKTTLSIKLLIVICLFNVELVTSLEQIPEYNSKQKTDLFVSLQHKFYAINPNISNLLPSIVNIKASDTGEFSDSKKEIIFLIDVSSSMFGEKIYQVKVFLKAMLNYLSPHVKMQFILFNNKFEVYNIDNTFFSVTMDNKQSILNKIESIMAGGGTNIKEPLKRAIEIFKSSGSNDSIKNIILLTDGEDNEREDFIEYLKTISINDNIFNAIHTVGYGVDHDTEILKMISEKGRGNYLVASDSGNVKKEIANILGSILSVFEKNLKIKIVLKPGVIVFKSLTKYFKPDEQNFNTWIYEHPTVTYGMNYNFGFVLQINKFDFIEKNFNDSLVDIFIKRENTDWVKVNDIVKVKISFDLEERKMFSNENTNKVCNGNYLDIENGIIIENNSDLLKNGDFETAKSIVQERLAYLKKENLNDVDFAEKSKELETLITLYEKKSINESQMYTNNYYATYTSNVGTVKKSRGYAQDRMMDDM